MPVDPWLSLPLSNLGDAALISVEDPGYAQSLRAAGDTNAYTATMAKDAPLVTFQVTGKSTTLASRTADNLVTHYDQTVRTLQTSSGVASVDLITPHRIDNGNNIITKSSSNAKLAWALVGLVGVLMIVVLYRVDVPRVAYPRRSANARPPGS